MYAHDRALLDRILAFDIDGRPATLTFERRLARECGWSDAFARRVVAEYRRFLYLAMTAGHVVTPSDEVDQAWHLHMLYTHSYWTRLCGTILPRALHHNPTAGGALEDAKYADAYQRTLESYQSAFGETPPLVVWPASADRFDPRRQFRRVRTQENWVVQKWIVRNGVLAVGGVSSVALLLGVASSGPDSSGAGGVVCFAIGLLVLACIFAATRSNRSAGRKTRSSSGSTCGTLMPFLFDGHDGSSGAHAEHRAEHGHEQEHGQASDPNDAAGNTDGSSGDGPGDSGGASSGGDSCGASCSSGCGGGGD